jgi:putative Mg2+ transporter-C (MgtC) family protein
LTVAANVGVGVGFLGAGIIVKRGVHVLGLTTAATVWFVAAIGVLCGMGLLAFGATAAIGLSLLLFVVRKIGFDLMSKD